MADKLNFAAAPEMGEAVEQIQPVAEPQPRRHEDRSFDINNLAAIQVGLASPDEIRSWSKGEDFWSGQRLRMPLWQIQKDPLPGYHLRKVRR